MSNCVIVIFIIRITENDLFWVNIYMHHNHFLLKSYYLSYLFGETNWIISIWENQRCFLSMIIGDYTVSVFCLSICFQHKTRGPSSTGRHLKLFVDCQRSKHGHLHLTTLLGTTFVLSIRAPDICSVVSMLASARCNTFLTVRLPSF